MLLLMIFTKAHEEEPEELAEEDQEARALEARAQEARALEAEAEAQAGAGVLEVHGKKEEQERNHEENKKEQKESQKGNLNNLSF